MSKQKKTSFSQEEDIVAFRKSWASRGALQVLCGKVKPGQAISLEGLPSAACAFVLAALTQGGQLKSLICVPDVKVQEELANDLEAWGVHFLFFPQQEPRVGESLPDQDLVAERLHILDELVQGKARCVLATSMGATQSLPAPAALESSSEKLQVGQERDRAAWVLQLEQAGYEREAQVTERGTYSVRGAIVDVFCWQGSQPLRTEWMGDELESLRFFDPMSQRSLQEVKEAMIRVDSLMESTLFEGSKGSYCLHDYLSKEAAFFSLEATETSENRPELLEFFSHDFLQTRCGDVLLQEARRELFLQYLQGWMAEEWEIAIFCNNEGEHKRLSEIIQQAALPKQPIHFIQGHLLRGFVWPQGHLVVLSDAEIFGRYQTLRNLRHQEQLVAWRARQSAFESYEFEEGDYVVHFHHGIALYGGVTRLKQEDGSERETLVLHFAEASKLYVPVEQAYLISKYVGVGKRHPSLDALGGTRWSRAKRTASRAIMDYAAQLLQTQAERQSLVGYTFPSDTPWQKEFEDAFLYQATEDQQRAILAAKADMESPRPMDRLICGDVGFGKTEVAIRTIFKAVMENKQVAFLVPTTVLAQQHFQNLRERFADYPIRVESLSRFNTTSQQRETLRGLQEGSVDVVVGTHRLISHDVVFRDLGLVVIDEEQRFGVCQKEKFKERFRLVDLLTLSATPIPRTLYLSLTGVRELSTIETPPAHRIPVETQVGPYDERVIRQAIERELSRQGQVFFLHNRVRTIHRLAQRLQFLVPQAKIEVGHGQMDQKELEAIMERFVHGEVDILLATTIIENGLDIPNANTILIDRADRFGLADLYQLRGRVGRSLRKAYAYLFLPPDLASRGEAKKRVHAIRQYSQLGSGFKIAMRDLEIRGAGSLLGTAQSGHISAIGFDLYCQLLKKGIAQLKGERPQRLIETKLDLDFLAWHEEGITAEREAACLPQAYVASSRERIEGYRRMAEVQTQEELKALVEEWKDRYGPFPPPVHLFAQAVRVRLQAAERGIHLVETQGPKLLLKRGNDYLMKAKRFPRLTTLEAVSKLQQISYWITSLTSAPQITKNKIARPKL